MPQYVLVMQQRGGGCDYTIGCGIKYRIMTAVDYPEAEKQAKDYIQDMYPPDTDIELERAYLAILPSHESLPLVDWYDEVRKINRDAEAQEVRDKELTELERLKAKYGDR
jgi:hypothetical protein